MIQRLRAASTGWVQDGASQMGAALAYYTLFSMAPLLFIAVAVFESAFGDPETRKRVLDEIANFSNPEIANSVATLLDAFSSKQAQLGTSIVGAVSLIFGATGMFTSLQSSLHRIWRLPPRKESVLYGIVRVYLLSFLMVCGVCTFILLLLLVSTLMPFVNAKLAESSDAAWLTPVVGFLVFLLLLMILFTFTYRFMSDGRVAYHRLLSGALVSALLFVVGKMAIGFYLAHTHLATMYGAAGSVVVFLAWVYYSAQIVFFGAEVIRFGLPEAQVNK